MSFKFYGSKTSNSRLAQEALDTLRGFLNYEEPKLVKFLQHIWDNQQRAITYRELREAILLGHMDPALIEEWMQDYSKFVTDALLPLWLEAMESSTKQLAQHFPTYAFDSTTAGIKAWIDTRAAQFVTYCTEEQIAAINAVVGRAALLQDMTVDELSRVIRPMVGLNRPQARANLNYYNRLIQNGIKEKRARELSILYSHRQHRYRGYMIARTELAFAYNKGQHEGVKQAQAQGLMGDTVKVWSTAEDERVCPTCGRLNGRMIGMDEDFDYQTRLAATEPGIRQTPPAHPHCRCAVIYEEIAPPTFDTIEEVDATPGIGISQP